MTITIGGKKPRNSKTQKRRKKRTDFSKRLVSDIRLLLWAVTLGGLALAAYCIHEDYAGALPWLSAMVGLPWTAHGVVCSFYINMAKSDHKAGGITFESAKATGFTGDASDGNSPPI
jgi:hypothetical protein